MAEVSDEGKNMQITTTYIVNHEALLSLLVQQLSCLSLENTRRASCNDGIPSHTITISTSGESVDSGEIHAHPGMTIASELAGDRAELGDCHLLLSTFGLGGSSVGSRRSGRSGRSTAVRFHFGLEDRFDILGLDLKVLT